MISSSRHRSQTSYLTLLCFILVEIIVGETAVFCLQLATKDFENQEKTILTGDCCYINPLVRRTIRFLGIYAFGLFATDIFVNAGQVVTGNLAPHFLALCKPNYTALGCKQYTQFISSVHACTGNPDLILKARKTFPSKEAALSVYAAMYLAMYITSTVKARGTRLAKPVLCLGLMCLAFLTGINRVAEYRNHWSDVIAGFLIGISIAVFLVVCVVNNFRGRQPEHGHSHMDNLAQMPMISIPRVESPLEKELQISSAVLSQCGLEKQTMFYKPVWHMQFKHHTLKSKGNCMLYQGRGWDLRSEDSIMLHFIISTTDV
ncbi:phospholipid phosphatase-related protein type 5 isoform X3 [Dromaius novaehollandiae]|uniref:phospholipid phosphatase-related protein type 5 isoform X3 n=1 Tax=Dromaius novaehollandiae TaxID=8790 RepID=UPI00311FF10F